MCWRMERQGIARIWMERTNNSAQHQRPLRSTLSKGWNDDRLGFTNESRLQRRTSLKQRLRAGGEELPHVAAELVLQCLCSVLRFRLDLRARFVQHLAPQFFDLRFGFGFHFFSLGLHKEQSSTDDCESAPANKQACVIDPLPHLRLCLTSQTLRFLPRGNALVLGFVVDLSHADEANK